MRFAINIELTDDELKKYAADVLRRVAVDLIEDMSGTLARHPQAVAVGAQMISDAFASKVKKDPAPKEPPPPSPESDPSIQ